jgi:preprotein translocase subunit SecA
MLAGVTSDLLDSFANEEIKKDDWNLDGLKTAIHQQFGANVEFSGHRQELTSDSVTETVKNAVKSAYEKQKTTLGPILPEVQKMILLQTIDSLWKEHLLRVDHLKEGINLRAYAQKDPLIEYKKEAFTAFAELDHLIKTQTLEKLLKIQLVAHEGPPHNGEPVDHSPPTLEERRQALDSLAPKPQRQKMTMSHPSVNGPQAAKTVEPVRRGEQVGRNDPCPCGSGKKYKKCHGANAELP